MSFVLYLRVANCNGMILILETPSSPSVIYLLPLMIEVLSFVVQIMIVETPLSPSHLLPLIDQGMDELCIGIIT